MRKIDRLEELTKKIIQDTCAPTKPKETFDETMERVSKMENLSPHIQDFVEVSSFFHDFQ